MTRMPFTRVSAACCVAGLFAAGGASAAELCPGVLKNIRSEIKEFYRVDIPCPDLAAAARILPITTLSEAEGTWAFSGERQLHEDLLRRYDIRLSTTLLPLGTLERDPPEGGGYLLVFALEMPRRSWALLAASQASKPAPTDRAAELLGEGASYDRVGVFLKGKDGRPAGEGQWLVVEHGGFYGDRDPAPIGETRACAPCQGWLCPPEAAACFSDFNGNRREELLMSDDCKPDVCGMRILEPGPDGRLAPLFYEPGVAGQWRQSAAGWALVPQPYCPAWGEFCGEGEASLGNPNCDRPEVYAFDPKTGALRRDRGLKDEFYPVENKKAPGGCAVDDRRGVLVMTKDQRFLRILP